MFKKSFGRFIALASLMFALFLGVSIIQANRQPVDTEYSEKSKPAEGHSAEGFMLETLIGSILTGIR